MDLQIKMCKRLFHSVTEAENIPTKCWNLSTKLHGVISISTTINYVYLFLFICTTVRTTATEWKLNCSNNNNNPNNNNYNCPCIFFPCHLSFVFSAMLPLVIIIIIIIIPWEHHVSCARNSLWQSRQQDRLSDAITSHTSVQGRKFGNGCRRSLQEEPIWLSAWSNNSVTWYIRNLNKNRFKDAHG